MIKVVDSIMELIDGATENYVSTSYNALVNQCMPYMIMAITIYIALVGWKLLINKTMTGGMFIQHTLKIAVIFSLTTSWEFFSTYLYDVLTNGPNQLAGLFLQAAGSSYDSPNSALQKVLEDGIQIGVKFWDEGGVMSDWLPFIFAVDIWIFVGVLTVVAVVYVAIAKIFLALLIALAPVFLYFLFSEMFKSTTDSWFRSTLGYALVPMMISCALLFTTTLLDYGITAIDAIHKNPDAIPGSSIIALIVFDACMLICILLIIEAKNIATQIAGGISMSNIGVVDKLAKNASPGVGLAKLGRAGINKWKSKG